MHSIVMITFSTKMNSGSLVQVTSMWCNSVIWVMEQVLSHALYLLLEQGLEVVKQFLDNQNVVHIMQVGSKRYKLQLLVASFFKTCCIILELEWNPRELLIDLVIVKTGLPVSGVVAMHRSVNLALDLWQEEWRPLILLGKMNITVVFPYLEFFTSFYLFMP